MNSSSAPIPCPKGNFELEEKFGKRVAPFAYPLGKLDKFDGFALVAEGKATWFEIKHPKLDKSVFFTGQPSAMGLPAMAVGNVLETNLYITPTNAPTWEAKSTGA